MSNASKDGKNDSLPVVVALYIESKQVTELILIEVMFLCNIQITNQQALLP